MLIKFKNPSGLFFSLAQEQIKGLGPDGSGSVVIIEKAPGWQTQAFISETPEEATDIINKQGKAIELTLNSINETAMPIPTNPNQPAFPPSYYSSYENAVQLGLVPGVSVNPYLFYAKNLNNDSYDTALYPYASTTPSANFLNPISGADTVLRIESDSPDDEGVMGGVGAQTVGIEGVKIDGTPVFENVILNGTTPVITSETFFRVRNMSVGSYGSNGTNVGNIIIKDNATGLTHWAMGPEDGNMTGSFTPQWGNALIVKTATLVSTSPYAEITIWLRYSAFETGRRKVLIQSITPGPQVHKFDGAGGLPAGIEIIPTVRHTKPLAPGETYNAYFYVEAYNITL